MSAIYFSSSMNYFPTYAELSSRTLFYQAAEDWGVAQQRLTTGLRINSAKDDPAGLLAGSIMRRDISALNIAIDSNNRMDNLLTQADTTLKTIDSTLASLQNEVLKGDKASLTSISNMLKSIDFLAGTASFEGKNLFSGDSSLMASLVGNTTVGLKPSAVNVSQIDASEIGKTLKVTVAKDASFAGVQTSDVTNLAGATVKVTGNLGSVELTFGVSDDEGDMADAINAYTNKTGVTADDTTTGKLALESDGMGSDQFVSIQVLENPNATTTVGWVKADDVGAYGSVVSDGYETGYNVEATIDGAKVRAEGRNLFVDTPKVSMSFRLDTTGAAFVADKTIDFKVIGGGTTFQIGAQPTATNQITLGLPQISTALLGGQYGTLDKLLTTLDPTNSANFAKAVATVSDAITQIGRQRSSLGSLQKDVIQSNKAVLQSQADLTTDQFNKLMSADVAVETSRSARDQLLMQSAISTISQSRTLQQSAALALLNT